MMRPNLWLAIFLAGCPFAVAQPAAAATAPEISLIRLIPDQPPENASLEALGGKFVVLEFWATWCAPCAAEIPRWNALVDRFKDRPMQFLSITHEEQGLVRRFLANHPISGWVGIARGAKNPSTLEEVVEDGEARFRMGPDLFRQYGIVGIPWVVVIDPKGRIVAKLPARKLSETILDDLLSK